MAKKIVLTISIVALILLQGGCQEKLASSKAAVVSDKPSPEISFEKERNDFGKVGPTTNSVCEFRFTNIGKAPLEIKNVSKTCSCTAFKLDKKIYEPGESGVLKVEYNAGRVPGNITRKLFVSSNDPKRPKVQLTITAKIVLKISYKPESLQLNFKDKNAGAEDITLKSIDTQSFAVTSFKSKPDCITADINPSKKSVEFVIKPIVDIKKLKKVVRGTIEITTTHPECRSIKIYFNATPEFKTTPASIVTFNAIAKKSVIRDNIWVLNNYGEDFRIESVSSKNGFVELLEKVKIDKKYKLRLKITPPEKDKTNRFTDVLMIKTDTGKELDLICRGYYARQRE